jgi:hypothetical protein
MWNLPYKVLLQYMPRQINHQSPYSAVSTPSDIDVVTPPMNELPSPSLSQAISLKASRQRADLFISGKFDELLKSLGNAEKK